MSPVRARSPAFKLFRTGTRDQFEYTDTVTLGQGERAIVEIEFEDRGLYMFHAPPVARQPPPSSAFQAVNEVRADEFGDCAPCLGQIGAKALLKY